MVTANEQYRSTPTKCSWRWSYSSANYSQNKGGSHPANVIETSVKLQIPGIISSLSRPPSFSSTWRLCLEVQYLKPLQYIHFNTSMHNLSINRWFNREDIPAGCNLSHGGFCWKSRKQESHMNFCFPISGKWKQTEMHSALAKDCQRVSMNFNRMVTLINIFEFCIIRDNGN